MGFDKNRSSLAGMGQVLTRKFGKQVFMERVGSSPPRVVYRLKGLEK